ncbi:MAG: class I SAM-dependent methyltransferase [Planctomycetes bacterium]|nr:class I SAM-dependent methyltransferase [Planctomycetota bacterium]
MTMPPGPGPILNLLQAFQSSAIVNSAIELGAFAALENGLKSAAQVGKAVGAPERSTAILLDAVTALGLLQKEGRKYRLSPLADAHLVPGRGGYIGDAARIVCDPVIWDAMGRFTQAVRHGGTVLHNHAESAGQKFWDCFAQHSSALAAPSAEYVAALLGRFMEERPHSRILDLACGSGLYGLTLARRFHHARVTLLDRANVLSPARRRTKETAVHERIEVLAADMFDADLGGPYDIVVASHVFHHFNARTCEQLLRRLGKVTSPGGRLIVHDYVPDETRTANAPAALFAALMLAWTREGNTYTYSEYTKLFAKGGFLAPVMHAPPHLTTQFLVGERKPRRSRLE